MTRDHQRPVLQPNATLEWIVGGDDPAHARSLAQETSWALLSRIRAGADPEVVERVITLAASDHGIDDIAELWAASTAHSLAGQLWRIYLLHRVAERDPEGTAELFRAGSQAATTIDPIVAGVTEPVTPDSIHSLCLSILRGVFVGDLAVALDRAASYCRVMSLGAAALADDRDLVGDEHSSVLTKRALRYSTIAADLEVGARRWRDSTLD